MADQTSASITIAAPPDAVLSAIADFAGYPRWSGPVKNVEVLATDDHGRGTQARFLIDAGVMRDEFVLAYDWSVPQTVQWQLISGRMQKAQHGSYVLTETPEGTEVRYELSVELAVPMLGLFKRRAEKMIIDTALTGLKRYVEAGSANDIGSA